jgi:hypothetical protein
MRCIRRAKCDIQLDGDAYRDRTRGRYSPNQVILEDDKYFYFTPVKVEGGSAVVFSGDATWNTASAFSLAAATVKGADTIGLGYRQMAEEITMAEVERVLDTCLTMGRLDVAWELVKRHLDILGDVPTNWVVWSKFPHKSDMTLRTGPNTAVAVTGTVRRVVEACDGTPVTAKIRLGCADTCRTAIEVAQRIEEAGAACLTVHGRVASQFFTGQADWDAIAAVKRSVSRLPVVGNGDIDSAEAAVARLRESGVDGVMIAREALAKPWIFAQCAALLRGERPRPDPTLAEQREIVLHHYDLVCRRFGVDRGTLLMRKFACSYAQGIPGAREFRGRISRATSRGEFLEAVDSAFPG